MAQDGISRRQVLKAFGALGAGAAFASVAGDGVLRGMQSAWAGPPQRVIDRQLRRRRLRPPGSRPFPDRPEGVDTMPQIEHIVVVMMENHSYDDRTSACSVAATASARPQGHPVDANPDGTTTSSARVPHAVDVPAAPRIPGRTGRRATPRATTDATTGSSRAQRSGVDGVLGRDRPPVLLRPREDVPGVRSLVLLGACADVSEPPLPDGRNCRRAS